MHYKLVYKKYLLKATKLGHKGKSLMRTDWCGAFFYFILKGHKNLYRKRIKVRWCRDSILQKKFWKFIPPTHAYLRANLRTLVHNRAHPCTPAHSLPHLHPPTEHLCIPTHTRVHPRTLVHTCAHPGTPANTRTHLRTPVYTQAHPHTSHTYPLMPADALNLINQMNYM